VPTVDGAHFYEIGLFGGGSTSGFDTRSHEELEAELGRLVNALQKRHEAANNKDRFGSEDDEDQVKVSETFFRLNGIPELNGEGKVSVFAAQVLGIVTANDPRDLPTARPSPPTVVGVGRFDAIIIFLVLVSIALTLWFRHV